MKELTVNDIINVCHAKLLSGNNNTVINSFSKDTRTILPEDMYIGIKGENFDGNIFCEKALEAGAIGCITDSDIDESILSKYKSKIILQVENSVLALQQLAEYKRSFYNIPVIAITGSVGKTSTKDIISSVVSQKYKVLKTEGNLNNQIGLPLTLLKLKDHNAIVLEMGMGDFGEIRTLTNIAKPTIAIITNIGSSHIGVLGSIENIFKAKLEILEGLSDDGKFILNNDDNMLHTYYEEHESNNIINYGIANTSNLNATNITCNKNNSFFDININNCKYTVNVPIGGKHFIYNSLAAICVGLQLNIDILDIISGIQNFSLTKNRMEISKTKNEVTIINDTYNSSYDALKASLQYLKNYEDSRRVAVLGDMLGLGDHSKEIHEDVAVDVIENDIDILVTVGKLANHISEKAISLGFNKNNIFHVDNNADAITLLNKLLKPNDVVLLKASHGMNFIEIYNGIFV